MSRLFYEKEKTVKRGEDDGVENGKQDVRVYLEKVAKLIPGEVLAAYLTMLGLAVGINTVSDTVQTVVLWSVFGASVIFTPVYMHFMADKDKPETRHLIISTVAFVVWAYQVTGDKLLPDCYNANFASIILILFTLVSGLIPLKKEKQ